jgi:uncharacterized protein (TIGR02246 family)
MTDAGAQETDRLDADERRRIEQDCRDLVAAVTQLGDRRDSAGAAALFAEDGTWIRGGRPYQGRTGIAESYERIPATQFTRHLSANCVIDVRDADHADAVTYYIAYHHDPGVPSPTFPLPLDPPFSLGEWHDRFVRTPEGWRIAHRETLRLFERRGGH